MCWGQRGGFVGPGFAVGRVWGAPDGEWGRAGHIHCRRPECADKNIVVVAGFTRTRARPKLDWSRWNRATNEARPALQSCPLVHHRPNQLHAESLPTGISTAGTHLRLPPTIFSHTPPARRHLPTTSPAPLRLTNNMGGGQSHLYRPDPEFHLELADHLMRGLVKAWPDDVKRIELATLAIRSPTEVSPEQLSGLIQRHTSTGAANINIAVQLLLWSMFYARSGEADHIYKTLSEIEPDKLDEIAEYAKTELIAQSTKAEIPPEQEPQGEAYSFVKQCIVKFVRELEEYASTTATTDTACLPVGDVDESSSATTAFQTPATAWSSRSGGQGVQQLKGRG
ncbi:uncharacterized protein B0I36DRAFT_355042 [Microdochium trichocladiopsis]|uniref:Uncharacterized protein n=1 Tax=Microdochium trichocladiopsis TaxID=1682393 RepID=A0A9P8XTE8_9PEZI|nr:uncharacterized protein B0I36DRAFT_355042 [Microdochium trichocladiopsis]KAH7016203.1 hypothetical protein B0I36DRAFT_355042 [Microdochium trichocladiopsis]